MVAILDCSVNCVCMWSTKKLTVPACCVAANCNNSQTTPGITMHELRAVDLQRGESGLNLYNSNDLTFFAPHHAHLCSEHFSECDLQNPWNTGTLSKSCLTGSD